MIVLVLNIGLKNARCIAFSKEGEQLSMFAEPVHTLVNNEKVEQNPHEWMELTKKLIGKVVADLGPRSQDAKILTVTTSASCFVAIDSDEQSVGNSILVSDTRSIEQCKKLDKLPEFQQLKMKGFKASPDLMFPKMMWLKNHRVDEFSKMKKYLNISDFLVGKLSGEYVTDPNNASKFYYCTEENIYPEDLYTYLGVKVEQLPRVVSPGEVVGKIRSSLASELGVNSDCEIIMSTYDALATVAGNGAFDSGDAVDVSGTVTSFRVVTDKFILDSKKRFYTSKHVKENQWLVGGSNNLGGGVIEWLRHLFYKNDASPYELMEKEALTRSVCPGGLIFLPHLLGERTPIWNSDCRGVFFGINRSHQRPDFSRAVFEGVAFSVAHIAEVLKEYDVSINNITVAGGLSQISLVNQIKSDLLGVPVKQFKNFETTAIGAALIALVGAGYYGTVKEAFDQFCEFDKIYEPDLKNYEIYNEYFELYKQTYSSLKSVYSARSNILKKLNPHGINELVMTENL